jgi:hypothetical protein
LIHFPPDIISPRASSHLGHHLTWDLFVMARIGIVFGLLLCVLAAAGLMGSTAKFPSLIFPMMLGIPILFCGVIGLNPHRRKLAMFSAAVIGTCGLVAGGSRAIYTAIQLSQGETVNLYAFRMILAMAVLCLLFVIAYGVFITQFRAGKTAK